MVSHWNLSDSKSSQVSGTLLRILADLKNGVVWMVSTCPLISKFSNPCTNLLVIVPCAPITIGITVTFIRFPSKIQVLTLPTKSCLILYSFCASLLHLIIMWLFVSSLSQHNIRLLFCCVLSILALIWLGLIVLFWAAIRRDSISLVRFPFLTTSTFSRVRYHLLVA